MKQEKEIEYVFVNCPFDDEYFSLLTPLLFTIIFLRYEPLISETKDSGKNRLDQIIALMEKTKYSIHDLSRIESEKPRFNMPLELGIDLGLMRYLNKTILVLEGKEYSLKSIMSDLAGNDTLHHNNNSKGIVKCVRDGFVSISTEKTNFPTYPEIYDAYFDFGENFEKRLKNNGMPIPIKKGDIPTSELIDNMKEGINSYRYDKIKKSLGKFKENMKK